jgi:hypothetical protein
VADLDPAVARLLPGREGVELSPTSPAPIPTSPPTALYRAGLPDLQNGPESLIRGARAPIQHVGVSGFRLPIRYRLRDGGELALETAVTGTVSLEAGKKGINMSRLMRSFYAYAEETFSFDVMERALDAYKADLGSCDARLQMRFRYPLRVASLRSGLSGWQYYEIALELVEQGRRPAEDLPPRLCLRLHLPLLAGVGRAREAGRGGGSPCPTRSDRWRGSRWRWCRGSPGSGSRTSWSCAAARCPRKPR